MGFLSPAVNLTFGAGVRDTIRHRFLWENTVENGRKVDSWMLLVHEMIWL